MAIDVDRPRPFDELRLLTNGGVIVEGTAALTDDHLAERLRPSPDAVLVANFAQQHRRGTLTLMPPPTKQPDGWHDWRPSILAIEIEPPFPGVEHVRSHGGDPVRFSAAISHGGLLNVHQRYPADQPASYPSLFGRVPSIEGTATPGSSGLRLQMTGPISPAKTNQWAPALVNARFQCDALIPWTYLRAVGSSLGYLAIGKFSPSTGPWKPAGIGPRALALNGEQAFFLTAI